MSGSRDNVHAFQIHTTDMKERRSVDLGRALNLRYGSQVDSKAIQHSVIRDFSFLFSIIIPNTSKQRMKIEREGKDRKITGKETVIHDSTFQALIWPFVRLGRWIKKERRKQIHDWLTAGSCPRGLIQNLSTISDQHALLRVLVNSMENKKDKGPWAETWIKRSLKLVNSSLDRTLRSMSSKPLDLFQFLC